MLFCLAFSLFVACLPHCTGTGIIQYTLARLYQQLKVHRHGQIGFLSFCLFAQLRLIAHCSPFAVPGNKPCIVSFIQIPTRLIHQQCPLYFHCRFTFIAVLHSDFIFPFCCILAAVSFRLLLFTFSPSAAYLQQSSAGLSSVSATCLSSFSAALLSSVSAARLSSALCSLCRIVSGFSAQPVSCVRRFPFPNTHVHAAPKVLTYLTER